MREQDLLAHIYQRSASLQDQFPCVSVGPGDDCAVVRIPPHGPPVLLKVDQVVEGRHFRPDLPPDLIARKALARPVSDLAAMAGSPTASLCAAVLPRNYAHADALFDAADRWARHFGCPLVGGDIAVSDGPGLVLSVTVLGLPHPTRGPVLRRDAKPGDLVYVSGELGGSLDHATGLGRHLSFEPRLREATALADLLGVQLHAMMDLSDGLGIDAGRLARASGARLDLEARAFPARDWHAALRDGEDHELLFTADPAAHVPESIAGTPITRIGLVVPGSGCWVLSPTGDVLEASALGWEHT